LTRIYIININKCILFQLQWKKNERDIPRENGSAMKFIGENVNGKDDKLQGKWTQDLEDMKTTMQNGKWFSI